jgi:hypothetical protein
MPLQAEMRVAANADEETDDSSVPFRLRGL